MSENYGSLLQELESLRRENAKVTAQLQERREEEARLRRSERELTDFFENAPLSLHWVSVSGTILRANRAELELLGYTEDAYIGRSFREFHADAAIAENLARLLEQGETIHNFPARLRCRDGAVRDVLIDASAMRENGEIVYSRCFTRDVTARRKAESELRASEERLRLAFDAAHMETWDHDLQTGDLHDSEGMWRLFHHLPNAMDFTLEEWKLCIYPDDLPRVEAAIETALHARREIKCEFRILSPTDDTLRWVAVQGSALRDAQGCPVRVTGVAWDITERRALQEQLFQAQKMESVGQLAGGIAHDFNNLMTAILSYTQLLAPRLASNAAALSDLQQIKKAGERASELTQQLLGFARKQAIEPIPLNLNALTLEMEEILSHLLGANIQLSLRPAPDLWTVRADRNQMEQTLLNLIVNGRDAMPHGGQLTLETANVFLNKQEARQLEGGISGEYVRLTVRDTGKGMTAAVRKRIFEPFFTTKPPGKGTGLGLATCYGILQQNRGYIDCQSEPGRGTTFHLYLPRDETHSEPTYTPTPSVGRKTLLLAEDDPALRELAGTVLRSVGYEILEAKNGVEALRIAAEYDGQIDLLVTDVMMPEMDGKELSKQLSAQHPDLPTLFISGYAESVIAHEGVLESGTRFLQKPFALATLCLKVEEVLERSVKPVVETGNH